MRVMQVKGDAIHFNSERPQDTIIEFPPVDLTKIKEGDEVWVKGKIIKCVNDDYGAPYRLQLWGGFELWMNNFENKEIIAHFPASPEAKPEYCKCNPKDRILCRVMECGLCHKCNKSIPINSSVFYREVPQPKPGGIEELDETWENGISQTYGKAYSKTMENRKKLNELIRAINGRGE